jgi:hypothetical protein
MNIYKPDEFFLDMKEWLKQNPIELKFPIFQPGCQKGELNSFYGRHHTEESKKLISENQKGWKHSDEAKEKIRLSRIGIKRSKEVCDKISKSNSGENHHMWGKICSDDVKNKISETKKNKPYKHNDAVRKKISEAAKLREMKKKCLI